MPSSETINKDTCNGNFMRYDSLEFTPGQKVAHAHTFLHNHSTEQGRLSPGMSEPMDLFCAERIPTGEKKPVFLLSGESFYNKE